MIMEYLFGDPLTIPGFIIFGIVWYFARRDPASMRDFDEAQRSRYDI